MDTARCTTLWLLRGLDVLCTGLTLFAVAGAIRGGHSPWPVVAPGAVFLAVYAAGRVNLRDDVVPLDPHRARWWPEGAWLLALLACWCVLLTLTGTAMWLAFPLMLLALHALGPRWGVVATGVVAAVSVTHGLLGGHGWSAVGSVLGPIVGASLAVAVVLGLEAIARESHEKQRLLDELRTTRDRLAKARAARAVADERDRLAREIHDTLAQGFAGIDLTLRTARAHVTDAPAAGLLDTAAATARDNLVEARRLVRALGPGSLEEASLLDALRTEARRAEAAQPGLRVELDAAPNLPSLPVTVEATLLRITQSALANVVQHAGATSACVHVSVVADAVTLRVDDDGRGIEADAPPAGGGYGITAMHDRAAQLGGTCVVGPGECGGTAVECTIPVPRRPA